MHQEAFNALRAFVYSDGARAEVYQLEDHIRAFPEGERAEALRYALEVWGLDPGAWTLRRLKEVHAYELAMGRPLSSFPEGTYALYIYDPEQYLASGSEEGFSALPEVLATPPAPGTDPDWDRYIEDWFEGDYDPEHDQLPPDTCAKYREAPSMEALLRVMFDDPFVVMGEVDAEGGLVVDLSWIDISDGAAGDFAAIRDMDLRYRAMHVEGYCQLMGLSYDYDSIYYCQGILFRRPDMEFVCAWDAIPHRQEAGLCILRRKDSA